MTSLLELAQRLTVSACAMTHTTEHAARRRGVAPFLPRLFADRFGHLGGIHRDRFGAELAGCRSFEDARWAGYWEDFAAEHLARADAALLRLGGPGAHQLLDQEFDPGALGELLAPAVTILADRGTVADPAAVERFCAEHPDATDAAVALDGLIKALTYEFVAAWPGWSPQRLRAYERSHRLCEVLLLALAPAMGMIIEAVQIPIGGGDRVRGFLMLPVGAAAVPTLLATNGLEGTLAEMAIPLLAQRGNGMGTFVMEMPGTYSYERPLTPASEGIYSKVIDYLVADPRIDGDRIGMVGFSFGAYWSVRMAATDPRLQVAVANGPLSHRSFGPLNSIGMPEIMVSTLSNTLGAGNTADLARRLRNLSLTELCRRIEIPLLVINGARDTLVSTRDSIDIAIDAANAQLVLYADDDHCAMGNAEHWSALTARFLADHLAAPGAAC
ncbi:alpha/beta hydrolase family protein [Nocardia mexicana]|uniref:Esterase FrsA n=1 Tax=Nocardia mexicana TaxID=279262 RepID=A0A370H5G1_9NOCA|nr:alpha/beta hydrolase [Nocardia mexicana]RDI51657.1 esterase FrsA [Nocardia mexicana]